MEGDNTTTQTEETEQRVAKLDERNLDLKNDRFGGSVAAKQYSQVWNN